MRSKLVVGNWKMNGSRAANAELLSSIVAGLDGTVAACAVCVPCVYLHQTQELLTGSPLMVGAQDVSDKACGAFTGEVAASMLVEYGCQYVIVGHSERRAYHMETSELVACKAEAVLRAGMTPIVCVGETLDERDAGQTNAVVSEQLEAVLKLLDEADVAKLVVAYEPVWAIGTGKTASPQEAQAVHALLRAQLKAATARSDCIRILYGGSMNAANAAELLAQADIDGGLVGGASLKPADFLSIIAAAH